MHLLAHNIWLVRIADTLTGIILISSSGQEMKDLQFLYLSNNKLDYIPVPLPESLRVLHLQVGNNYFFSPYVTVEK